ncbi:uroporphyrinogen-III synthase, partial [Paenibacillus sp. 1001270B_150601_E10]|uniref:uroporphyrinogen-III synthase n=1 Tax=Paenibacillus sp. 1001270B_150601_E10 TaxID=2787079 RepID=UPI001E458E84
WLRDQLVQAGLSVTDLDTYHTVLPDYEDHHIAGLLADGGIQFVPFTSSSTVKNTLEMLQRHGVEDPVEALNRTSIFCIGEMTAKTAKEAGLKVSAVSEVSTMDDLMDTMLHWLKASQAASELSPSNLN